MSWDDSLTQYGLANTPISFQQSGVQNDTSFENTSLQSYAANLTALGNFSQLPVAVQVGAKIFLNGQTGQLYAGNTSFTSAPFSVDSSGNLIANSLDSTGTITAGVTGGQRIVIDGSSKSISFYDSSNTVVGYFVASTGNLFISPNASETSAGLNISVGSHEVALYTEANALSQLILQAQDNSFNVSSIILSPTNISTAGNFNPDQDNLRNLGQNGLRWQLIRGVTITSGDLAFEELSCYLCGKDFTEGDKLGLVVKQIEPDQTRTVPIHLECPGG